MSDKAYRFFAVRMLSLKPGRKTREYEVVNRRSGDVLGTIAWYGPWRQFCFLDNGGCVWSIGCLGDLMDAIRQAEGERKEE